MKFTLTELTEKDINTILQALSNMPYNQVAEIIHNIQMQATNQLQPKEDNK